VTKSVIVCHNILIIALLDDEMFKLMTQLISLIAFISAEKCKFTQTLNVSIILHTTEDAYKGLTKYLLCLDREYKQ